MFLIAAMGIVINSGRALAASGEISAHPNRCLAPSDGGNMKRLRAFGDLMMALLRELSDESAYHRHLAAHGRSHSPEEWRQFSDQKLRAKYHRPKCC